jgi:uncharacterized protein YbjT (DUF2867 family)
VVQDKRRWIVILVVGATGLLGTDICRLLAAEGHLVRALVRPTANRAKRETLERLGIEIVQGDLKEQTSLEAACKGISTVMTTASALPISYHPGNTIQMIDLDGQTSLIDTALAAGVTRFIYVSYSGNIDSDDPLTKAKRTVEKHLEDSGLTYTILRPSFFMETWLSAAVGFDVPNAKVQVFGAGHNKISWISRTDVARFAVAALLNPAARNATIELGGPEALSPLEVIGIFESITNRRFEVQHVPEETLREERAAASDPMQQSFAALMLNCARGDAIDMDTTSKIFSVSPSSVRVYAQSLGPASACP